MKNDSYAKLLAAMNTASKSGSNIAKDENEYFYPERDKAGNGYAVIRFLPTNSEDLLPWAKTYSHGFQNKKNGKWFIEECPTTIGNPCPLCEDNAQWFVPTATEAMKTVGRQRKRKLQYISNVLVVTDSKHPENEGRVMLFKYGAKIFTKLQEAMSPPEPAEGDDPVDPCNIWDLEDGANFKFRIRKVENQTNYDKSDFDKPSAVENAKDVMSKIIDLTQFTAPEKYKTYDKLKERLDFVLKGSNAGSEAKSDEDVSDVEFAKNAAKAQQNKPAASKVDVPDDDDDPGFDADYFTRLAAED